MTKQERLLKEQKVNNVNITLKPALYQYEWEEEVAKNFGLTKFEADDKKLLLKKYYNNYLDTNNNRYYLRLREVQDRDWLEKNFAKILGSTKGNLILKY